MIKTIQKIIGTKNDKEIKRIKKIVEKINKKEKEKEIESLEKLKEKYLYLSKQIKNKEKKLDEVLIETYAIIREVSKRILKMRHFDVQIIGGIVIHQGKIAEMKTGEGKTLVATLPAILNAMTGEGVHIVTVNDYLAKRDAQEMKPLYDFFNLKLGIILEEKEGNKKDIYESDIIYGTNNEFGFDYLRDKMAYNKEEVVQKKHAFVIIDEIDSILIDEARTPLIISGEVELELTNYILADKIAKEMKKDIDYEIDEKDKIILLTEKGINVAEKLFEVKNLYSKDNIELSHILTQALKANYLFEKDIDYVLKDNEIIIVDEFTGRLSEGRRFSEGLHQALEAKENVEIKEETQTFAEISFQNYFRLYEKIAGMTGTASTEATEFSQIYNLEVVSIPTNLKIQRKDLNDLIYKTEKEKIKAVIEKIEELKEKEQPVLIGTASIEKSEELSNELIKKNIKHNVLNAKNHEKEAEIIKEAGKKGAITIATNMAGRGVDIKITEEINKLGGLYIIGTERHENRRIDNQLRGRSGRQGDNGITQFYLSLEDNLLRIFGGEKLKTIMNKLGVKEGEYIDSKLISNTIEKSQKKVENMYFESRKHLVEYDDVINEQRKIVYKFRNQLLEIEEGLNLKEKILENRQFYIQDLLKSVNIFPENIEEIEKENLILLKEKIQEELNLVIDFEEFQKSLNELNYEIMEGLLLEILTRNYEEKMNKLETEIKIQIEREMYLEVLDKTWKDHLHNIDNMKEGIRLRAYNQKDPLVEYKKESFNLFNDFIKTQKTEIIKILQLIDFELE